MPPSQAGPRPIAEPAPPPHPRVSRLAPSPTGALHLGNARTFLVNWALARKHSWKLYLRIEDLETPRVKPGAAEDLADILRWLGLDWDPWPGHPTGVLVQSADLQPYRHALQSLAEQGLAYPCTLTRADLERAAAAPHAGEHELRHDPSLRPPTAGAPIRLDDPTLPPDANWRFLCPPGPIPLRDRLAGHAAPDPGAEVGDFVLWTKRNQPAYQLAVVVDDHRQGVTDIVRGIDLLPSTARQRLLARALRLAPEPDTWHLPLVVGPDGRRLAKRHGDTRIDHYRALGVPPGAVLGLIARWTIPALDPRELVHLPAHHAARLFADRLTADTIPTEPVVMREEDDQWLKQQA